MTLTRSCIARALLCALLGAFAAPAVAQQRDLPAEVVRGQPQAEQLKAYVDENVALLSSQDPKEVSRGRTMLLRPLDDRQASVAFRDLYSSLVVPRLTPLVAGPSEINAIDALFVAGGLATAPATQLIENSAQDPRGPVRFAAAAALGRTFRAISQSSPAIVPGDATALVQRLSGRLAGEENAHVFDRVVRSLIEAGNISRDGYQAASAAALSGMARGVSDKLSKLTGLAEDDAFVGAANRAAGTLRDAAGNNARPMTPEQLKLAAELGGRIWGWVFKGISGGHIPLIDPNASMADAEKARQRREFASKTLSAAQGVIAIALGRLQPGQPDPFQGNDTPELVKQATRDSDSRVLQKTREYLGPAGVMSRPPLSFEAGTFIR
jgi:hypothetical protein